MRRIPGLLVWACGAWACMVHAQADTDPGRLYRQTCSTCHDGGGGGAPRLSRPDDWQPRLIKGREALVQSAVKGVPNSAMMAKGGYELSEAQVASLVDWMLLQLKATQISTPSPAVLSTTIAQPQTGAVPLGAQAGLSAHHLAVGLRAKLGKADQRIESVDASSWVIRGLGIKVSVQTGAVVLSGSVEESNTVQEAEIWVRQQAGVTQVSNRLVAASVFEWD